MLIFNIFPHLILCVCFNMGEDARLTSLLPTPMFIDGCFSELHIRATLSPREIPWLSIRWIGGWVMNTRVAILMKHAAVRN